MIHFARPGRNYLFSGLTILIICLLTGSLVYYLTSKALIHNVETSLVEVATQGAKIVEKDIAGHLDVLETLALMEPIADEQAPVDRKLRFLESELIRSGHRRMTIADAQGNGRTTDGVQVFMGDRDYFTKAMAGVANVSDPLISRVDRALVVIFAVPIYSRNRVVGVLTAAHDADILSNITDQIRLGEKGSSFIINGRGVTIAHDDRSLVYRMDNDFVTVNWDPSLKPLVRLERQMTAGATGAGEYIYHGVQKYLGFAPIPGTGWSIAVTAPKSQIFSDVNLIMLFFIVLACFLLLVLAAINISNVYLRGRLKEEELTSQNAIDTANLLIIELYPDGKIRDFNKYATIKLGFHREEVIGTGTIFDLIPEVSREKIRKLLQGGRSGKTLNNFEFPLRSKDGKTIHMLWSLRQPLENVSPHTVELMGIDISERIMAEKELRASHAELSMLYQQLKAYDEGLRRQFDELCATQDKLMASEERFRLAQEGSNDVIWDWDIVTDRIFFSGKIMNLLGFTQEELGFLITGYRERIHPEDAAAEEEACRLHLEGITPAYSIEYRIKTKNGAYKWIFARGKAVRDKDGRLVRMAGSLTDIDWRKANEARINQLAYYDPLTGLPNRLLLNAKAGETIRMAEVKGNLGVLLFIDIDNFKFVNDTFGHSFGDRLLVEVGERITSVIQENTIVSRLGGDEFIVLVDGFRREADIRHFIDELMETFDTPFDMNGNIFPITVSIGVAVFPQNGDTVEELLKHADMAMYRAKGLGKSNYVFYDPSMDETVTQRLKLGNNLRMAIENQEFTLYYQPLMDRATGRIYSLEALIRWNSPEYGLVSPGRFMKLAEENGLIVPIGEWVLQNASAFASRLRARGLGPVRVAVNISIVQLMQNDFLAKVKEALHKTGLPPDALCLEITETLLMESFQENTQKLEALKKYGVSLSLDDFGTGYSSLNYLKRLPIDHVKIDKSFVDDIIETGNGRMVIGSIITLAHQLGLKVVAEGVETREQLDCLSESNCDIIQGYLISPPVPAGEAEVLFTKEKLI